MIRELFETLEPMIKTHGYWVVGAILLLENMGIPLPGELVLVACGVLASTGGLDPVWVGIIAVMGCIIGDNLGFALGRWFNVHFMARYQRLFRVSPQTLETAKSLFLRYGGWAVFFGRFIALLRMLAGPLAGMLGMRWSFFLTCNTLGAIVWVCTILTASVYFGHGVDEIFDRIGLWGIVLCLAGLLAFKYHLGRFLFKKP